MTPQSKAFTVLTDKRGSAPSTHKAVHSHLSLQVGGNLTSSLDLCGYQALHGAHAYRQAKHS